VATYKDIQRITGLSLATISKYYNGLNILPRNRQLIEEAAGQLGYRVNAVASNLRRGSSRTVGVLLPALENGFHMSIVAGVERELRADGISLIVASTVDESPAHRSVDLLISRMVDAIVTVPAHDVVPSLAEARQAGVPVISMDWEDPDLKCDTVTLDNYRAGRIAGRHLLDHGHRRIALIGGIDAVSTMHQRAMGFLDAMLDAGQNPSPDLISSGPLEVRQGHSAMRALLDNAERPTAVFTANYELTIGAIIAINESGIRLGADLSMVGFDNADLAQVTVPRLTVITQPIDEIALAVADIVRARLSAKTIETPLRRQLRPHLGVGNSVATLR